MAEQVFGSQPYQTVWPGRSGGRGPAPAVVSGVAHAPDPGGHGGTGLLGNLLNLANVGASVYDKVWGPGRLKDDLAFQIQQENLAKLQRDRVADAQKLAQTEYERRVEAATGQKFGPELAQATTQTRDIMLGKGGGQGEVGPLGGPQARVTPDSAGPPLVARPWRDLPGTLGKEAAGLRAQAESATEQLPPGPARDRTRESIVRGPQVPLPSDVVKTYKGYSEAGKTAGEELIQGQKVEAATAGKAAMDRFRATGDRRHLIEAMTYDSAGPGQILEQDRKSAEAAITHFDKIQEAKAKFAEAVKKGYNDPVMMESMARDINLLQLGFSRLTNNPYVMLHPPIATPGIIYGKNYKTSNFVTDMETANRYIMGQMDPSKAQDLLSLGGIQLGINKPQGGRFDPDQAAVLKRYIAEYPGANLQAIREAHYWIDQNTAGVQPGGSYPVDPTTGFTPNQQSQMGVSQEGIKQPVPPGTMGPELRQQLGVTPEGRPLPGGEAERQIRSEQRGVPAGATREERAVQERWGTRPGAREPFMRPQAPEQPVGPPPRVGVPGAEGAIPPEQTPLSPRTGPRNLETLGSYATDLGRSLIGKRTREQVAADKGTYGPMIVQMSNELRVPVDLALRVAEYESGYNPRAYNNTRGADAVGIFQLRKGAAQDMGLAPEERADPAKNIRGGVGYLGKKLKEFGGRAPLALAAYHMGSAALRSGEEWGPETRKYVQAITGESVTDEKIRQWLGEFGIIYGGRPIARPAGAIR